MLLVVILGAIVLGVGTEAYGRVAAQRAVANARDAMMLTAFRARSEAVRSGRLIYLNVDPDAGLVEVATSSDSVMDELRAADYGARMVGADASVCYTGRGYALPSCSSGDLPRRIGFVRGNDTSVVVIMPLGQIRRIQ